MRAGNFLHLFIVVLTLMVGGYFLFFYSSTESPQPSSEVVIDYNSVHGRVHGTYYNITYKSDTSFHIEADLHRLFERIDNSLSMFRDTSIISRVNQNDTTVRADDYFTTVFRKGQEVSEATNGAFDMTVAPLVNHWGFGFDSSSEKDSASVDSILTFVGYKKVWMEGDKVRKSTPSLMLDASAIAKGYSCDVVANFLRSVGITDFLVEIGGEIVSNGVNRKGATWTVGISKPTDDNDAFTPEIIGKVQLPNCGLATSGNYRRFYYKDGQRYSHTIDPKTGFPVQHKLLSATVIAPDCMTADAYATSFMVMGLDSALSFVSQKDSLAAYFIYTDEKDSLMVRYSDAFLPYLTE